MVLTAFNFQAVHHHGSDGTGIQLQRSLEKNVSNNQTRINWTLHIYHSHSVAPMEIERPNPFPWTQGCRVPSQEMTKVQNCFTTLTGIGWKGIEGTAVWCEVCSFDHQYKQYWKSLTTWEDPCITSWERDKISRAVEGALKLAIEFDSKYQNNLMG